MLDVDAGRMLTPLLLRELVAISERAAALDEDVSFPEEDVSRLARIGTLAAPFASPADDTGDLMEALRAIGHASLPLGRLIEGHVNAAILIRLFGTPRQQASALEDARAGALFGVWNTEAMDGVRLLGRGDPLELVGSKVFASGAGHLQRPLITARDEADRLLMVLPRLDSAPRADLSAWQAHGMRASASGRFDFTGLRVEPDDIIGQPADYHRQPHFSGGAWRFCAVQLGGIERLVEEALSFLRGRNRDGDPHQQARMGEAVIAAQTARLWVERASRIVGETEADANETSASTVAYVDLARCAVERCGLQAIELAQRSIGLSAFQRTNPVERLARDLATYLRQPAPDRALCEGAAYVLGQKQPLGELWR